MKKSLALLLALAMLLTLTSAVAENADGFKYPMENAPEISWFVSAGYAVHESYASWEDSPFHTGLIKATGVNIDWSFPTAGTDGAQALNLVLASPELPDIIYGGLMTDAERYMDEGVIRDITDDIQKYAPNYYAFLQSNPAYDKAMKTDAGKYYGFGFFREDGGWNDTYEGPVVRQDWLKECGLEIPKTISEFENVIKVFNEKYGAKFTTPWKPRFHDSGLAGAFGAYGCGGTSKTFGYYVDENGKVQLAQAQKEWLNYMVKLNEWWDNGLLDQDLFTLDDTSTKTKALNGTIGLGYTSMGQLTNWKNEAEAAKNGADWIGIPYPTADDGSISTLFGGYGIGNTVAVVTGDCPEEEVETALRLLDYAYSKEGNLYWNFGTQGVSWDYNAEGLPEYTKLVTEDPDGLNDAIAKYCGSVWSGNCIQATRLLHLKNNPTSIAANDTWFYAQEGVPGRGRLPSGITLTADESDEAANYESAIFTYVPEMAAKLITGEADASVWDEYIQTLDKMGLAKALEIQQAAYDRFMAR